MELRGKIPIQVVLPAFSALQIFVVVAAVVAIMYTTASANTESITETLREVVPHKVQNTVLGYLNNASVAAAVAAMILQTGTVDVADSKGLIGLEWSTVKSFAQSSVTYFGRESDGAFVGYDRVGLRPEENPRLVYHPAANMGNMSRESWSTDSEGNRQTLISASPYDSRTRPWYIETKQLGRPIWSTVYPFARSGELGITACAPVYNRNGSLLGVVGIDLTLSRVTEFLAAQEYGKTGSAFLMERSGDLVASSDSSVSSSDAGAVIRLSAKDSPDERIRKTATALEERFGLNGIVRLENLKVGSLLVSALPVQGGAGLDWLLVVMIPESDWFSRITKNRNAALGIAAAILVVCFSIGVLFAIRIVRPLQKLAGDIRGNSSSSSWFTEVYRLQAALACLHEEHETPRDSRV